MKHIAIIFFSALVMGGATANIASAQQQQQRWQGLVKYRGYTCYMLGSADNPQVLVAKGTDAGGYEVCHIKFRSPYKWSNDTEWACMKGITIDLHTGSRHSGDLFSPYKNGWIYLSHYFGYPDPVIPYYNYIITVYKDNDAGQSGAQSKTINLNLDKLNVTRLPVSDKAFETHW